MDSVNTALTSAVFGQQVSLLFMNAGVEHLRPAAGNDLEALRDYDIDEFYAQQQALETRQLIAANLQPQPHPVDEAGIAALLASQNCVLHF